MWPACGCVYTRTCFVPGCGSSHLPPCHLPIPTCAGAPEMRVLNCCCCASHGFFLCACGDSCKRLAVRRSTSRYGGGPEPCSTRPKGLWLRARCGGGKGFGFGHAVVAGPFGFLVSHPLSALLPTPPFRHPLYLSQPTHPGPHPRPPHMHPLSPSLNPPHPPPPCFPRRSS